MSSSRDATNNCGSSHYGTWKHEKCDASITETREKNSFSFRNVFFSLSFHRQSERCLDTHHWPYPFLFQMAAASCCGNSWANCWMILRPKVTRNPLCGGSTWRRTHSRFSTLDVCPVCGVSRRTEGQWTTRNCRGPSDTIKKWGSLKKRQERGSRTSKKE